MKYIVIAKINGKSYAVSIKAESASGAEHAILDRSVVGRHEYSVEGAQAFAPDEFKFDHFVGALMDSETVSFDEIIEIIEIIEKRNEQIKRKDAAEEEIRATEKLLKDLESQIAEAKERIESARRVLREI